MLIKSVADASCPYIVVVVVVQAENRVGRGESSFHVPGYIPVGRFPGFGGEDIDSAAVRSYPQLPFPFGEA